MLLVLRIASTLCALAMIALSVEARRANGMPYKAPPMFVFGSSYVDTGNVNSSNSMHPSPWSKPYGETWPGRPVGRFSNGFVLTDAIAEAFNMTSPTNFVKRFAAKEPSGLNFAAAGSTVLPTRSEVLPISSQIDAFRSIVSSYSPQELASAIVLYCASGDDYYHTLATQASSLSSIYPLTVNVGKQISVDLIELYRLGLRNFIVTYLPPTGCLPLATAVSKYRSCNSTWTESIAQPHNARVFKNVLGLRHYFKNGSITLLDLYNAFSFGQTAIGFGDLKPCCIGLDTSAKCGGLDLKGKPSYSLCSNPSKSFYWDDTVHPTQEGWKLVVRQQRKTLEHILN